MRVRRCAKGRREPLSDAVRHYLETGEYGMRDQSGRWFDVFLRAGQVLRAAARERTPQPSDDWLEWGEEITADYRAERPGYRPHGWWVYDAPGPRECGGLPPELHRPAWLWRLRRGIPFEDYMLPVGAVLFLESEPHYLRRHALLELDERRRLTARDFEPEQITVADPDDTDEADEADTTEEDT